MSGRPIGKRHQDDVRAKIQSSLIINRLHDAFNGKIELTAIQVNIGKTLLDKALPDLKAIEHTGDADNPIQSITRIELVAFGSNDNDQD